MRLTEYLVAITGKFSNKKQLVVLDRVKYR